MKVLTLLRTLSTAILATATAGSAPDLASRSTDCDLCFERYDFCVDNGHSEGQTGCKQTCGEHVCHVQRHQGNECRGCGDEFRACGERSRYDF